MQNKLFIALMATLGLEGLLPTVAEGLETAIPGEVPSYFLLFAGVFCVSFIAEKAYNTYANR